MALQQALEIPDLANVSSITALHVINDSQVAIATHNRNTECVVRYLDLDSKEAPWCLKGHNNAIESLASKDNILASGAHDKIMLWDLHTRELKRSFVLASPATANGLLFWDEDKLISCHYDKIIRIWSLKDEICLRELAGHTHKYGVQRLSRWNDYLLSVAENVRMWDVDTGESIKIFEAEGTHISKIVCDERLLVGGCPRHHASRVWDLQTGKLLGTLERHQAPIGHVAMTDAKIFTGAADGTIAVWSKTDFKLLQFVVPPGNDGPACTPRGCVMGITSLHITNDMVLASGWDGVAKISRVNDELDLQTLGDPRHFVRGELYGGKAFLPVIVDGRVVLEVWTISEMFVAASETAKASV